MERTYTLKFNDGKIFDVTKKEIDRIMRHIDSKKDLNSPSDNLLVILTTNYRTIDVGQIESITYYHSEIIID